MRILTPAPWRAFQLIVVTFFAGLLPYITQAQVSGDYRSLATGNWSTAGTWQTYNGTTWATAVSAPGSTNNVLIRDGHTITIGAAASCNNLTVGEGATGILNIGAFAITVSGNTLITAGGRINVTGATGTKSFTGNFTNNGTWSNSGNSAITFLGDVTNNSVLANFAAGSGVYSFSGSNKTINTTNGSPLTIPNISLIGSYTISSNFGVSNPLTVSTTLNLTLATSSVINNGVLTTQTLTITNAGGVFTNNGTTTVSLNMNGSTTSSFINAANSVLNVAAATINPVITATANPNLVNYNLAGAQNIKATTYHNLTISNSGTKTVAAGGITVNRDIVVSGTAILADGNTQITGNASGTFTVGSGAGYTTTRTATSWFPTNIPLASYTLDDNSTVTFNAAATLTNAIPATYGHLVFGTGTKTLPASYPLTVNGNLSLTGIIADNGNTITVKGGISGTAIPTGTGKILLTGGSAPHSIQGTIWNNVELDDAQGATLAAAFTIGTNNTGVFTLTNGVVSLNNFDFTINNINGGFSGSGFSASKMLLQNGTGVCIHRIGTSGFPITYAYPIGESTGTTEYSPVSVTVNSNTIQGNLEFTITDAQHPADINTTNYASRYFTATAVPSGTINYSAAFGYTGADIVGTESTFDVFTYDGSNWGYVDATAAANQVTFNAAETGIVANEAFVIKAPNVMPSTVTIDGVGGTATTYANLTGATGLFATLNQSILAGNLTVNVTAASVTEPGTVALNQVMESGAGAGTYTITIQPGNTAQKTLTGNVATAMITLNGADRVIFDGRPNGSGTTSYLTMVNANTSGSTIRFTNDAKSNSLQYCKIQGSGTSLTTGVVSFLTAATGGTGNTDNVIDNCDLGPGAGTVGVIVYSAGTATAKNRNTISNNLIHDYYVASATSQGLNIAAGNTGWQITGNRFYQTASRPSPANVHAVMLVTDDLTSNPVSTLVDNNIIGYAASNETGTYTLGSSSVTPQFIGIQLGSSNGRINVTNNKIQGIAFSSNSGSGYSTTGGGLFCGILLPSGSNPGNVTGNYIGTNTGVNTAQQVTVNAWSGSMSIIYGIRNLSTSTALNISSNVIGDVRIANATTTVFYGINSSAGTLTANNNYIGSNSTTNNGGISLSGSLTGANPASIIGIQCTSTSGLQTISNNIIGNFINPATNTNVNLNSMPFAAPSVAGIVANSATQYAIYSNTIRNMSTAVTPNNVQATVSSLILGIALNSTSTAVQTINDNTITNLTGSGAGQATTSNSYGIYFSGGTNTSNSIYNNYINGISSAAAATTATQIVTGIGTAGTGVANVFNNMVKLGVSADNATSYNNAINIVGIDKGNTGAGKVYFNTVYIRGAAATGVTNVNTFALRRTGTNAGDDLRNNILV
ncbi:MAG: hypothetical protein RLZZ367_1040, partial [Bacteroidota bacterium]